MTEEQAKALKVGDKVKLNPGDPADYASGIIGNIYEIAGIDADGDPYISHSDFGGVGFALFDDYLEDFELVTIPYSVKNIATWPASDDGLTHIEADVNKAMLDFMRGIEKDQARETKRQAIREQIAKLEAELEAL